MRILKSYTLAGVLCLLFFSIVSQVSAQQIRPDSLDRFIEQMMQDFDVPGLSIGILQGDSVLLAQGYGTRVKGKDLPVDVNTTFGIGSISKSFTALTLAILVDRGKLDWDDRVVDYIPYFELYDPYVTAHFTIRDLLTHRSGLRSVSGGLLWYHADFTREQLIRRMKYLEPVSGFREKQAYQNIMYVVAGEVVAAVTGMEWDAFLEQEVFAPLGMNVSTSRSEVREKSDNIARPHVWDESFTLTEITQEKGDNLAAGGFIYSSASDMMKYLTLLLNDGIYKGDTLVTPDALSEVFSPQEIFPMGFFRNEFTSYGFGWVLTPMNGDKFIEHSGGIDGMSAYTFMLKDADTGVIILTNEEESPSTTVLGAELMYLITGEERYNIYDAAVNWWVNLRKDLETEEQRTPVEGTETSVASDALSGTYRDEGYGDIYIRDNEGSLTLEFSHTPIFTAELQHWHYNTFRVDWHDIRIPDGWITFQVNSNNEVTGFTLDQEKLLDVDFAELEVEKVP